MARTKKGKGVADLEDVGGWHGKALKPDQAKAAIKELGGERQITIAVSKPNLQIQRTSTSI